MKTRRGQRRLTQAQLAAEVWPGDEDAAEKRKGDISKLENGKVPNPHPTTVERISKVLGFSEADLASYRAEARKMPREQLEHVATLSRDDLELLAHRFEIAGAYSLPDAELRKLLTQKAEEYRRFKAQIDGLDDRVAAIANLKGAAQDAAEKLDLEEVEALLSRVDEVETEIAADTKVARADNALLRGRVEDAYRLLTAAADSFASVDPLEPARRRFAYSRKLYEHGLRYGVGSDLAIAMYQQVLAALPRDADPDLWAKTQMNLGNALQTLGQRETGTERLEQAVAAYERALQEWTRDRVPLDWAKTQNNLGNALATLGQRETGTDRLEQAVAAYERALQEFTRDRVPLDWAMTQNNLGTALQTLGQRETGTDRLEQAVAAYERALQERTRDRVPLDWATTQMNLGIALRTLGEREAGTAQLEQAVAAYERALLENTRDRVPFQWAMTQECIAWLRKAWFEKDQDPAHLREGLSAVELALEVYEDAGAEYRIDIASKLRDQILSQLTP